MDQITKINLQDTPAPKNTNASPTVSRVPLAPASRKVNLLLPLIIVAVLAGIGSGYVYAKKHMLIAGGKNPTVLESSGGIKVGTIVGASDESTFKDKAEGVLQPGGISGEGSHHLVRGDNQSQWVYLTSSVIDLDQYVGDKVIIWGETIQGKKAGWLMDVGRLKVTELNAAQVDEIKPSEN